MTTLFLVRHGLTAHTGRMLYGQTPGIDLDERGRAQAEQLAERLATVRPTAIYSSPLERCVQTVAPLAAACRLPVVEHEGLIEMHAGSWTGKPLARLRTLKAWGDVQQRPGTFRFPGGGESFAEARDRVAGRAASDRAASPTWTGRRGDARRHPARHARRPRPAPRSTDSSASWSTPRRSRWSRSIGAGHPRVHLVNDTGDLARFTPGGGTPAWEAAASREHGARARQRSVDSEPARIGRMDLGAVDRITTGTIGEPGSRTFYLQARAAGELVTIVVEKQQVQLLAASILELLGRPRARDRHGPERGRAGTRGTGRSEMARRQALDRLRPRPRTVRARDRGVRTRRGRRR